MTPHSNCHARHPKRGAVDPGQTLPAGKRFENSDVGAAGVLPDHLEVKVVAKAKLDPLQSRRFPAAEREQRIAKLEDEIDRLQRTEEAIIVAIRCATRGWMPALGCAGC